MNTLDLMPPTVPAASGRPVFLTPLARDDLFDPGQVFPRPELTRRVLSIFWRDCCCPPCFSRAPAPVIEVAGENADAHAVRLRAWWLLHDGILEEREGPYAERLRPFFERAHTHAPLWPSYEFRVLAGPTAVEMTFHQHSFSRKAHRTNFALTPDDRLCVTSLTPHDVA